MNKYMEIANSLAKDNLNTRVGGPFGACIVKDGEIIGKGSNHVLSNNDPTAHAEIMAIRDACSKINSYDLSDCDIYTSCYPCPMCLSAIIWANIKNVYYGNTKEDAERIGFRDDFIYEFLDDLKSNKQDSTVVRFEKMDHEETKKVFDEYLKDNNREIY